MIHSWIGFCCFSPELSWEESWVIGEWQSWTASLLINSHYIKSQNILQNQTYFWVHFFEHTHASMLIAIKDAIVYLQ